MADIRSLYVAAGEDLAGIVTAQSGHGFVSGCAILTGCRDYLADTAYWAERTSEQLDEGPIRTEFAVMLGIVGYRVRQSADDLAALCARYNVR